MKTSPLNSGASPHEQQEVNPIHWWGHQCKMMAPQMSEMELKIFCIQGTSPIEHLFFDAENIIREKRNRPDKDNSNTLTKVRCKLSLFEVRPAIAREAFSH